jgi:hypothetical protein
MILLRYWIHGLLRVLIGYGLSSFSAMAELVPKYFLNSEFHFWSFYGYLEMVLWAVEC